MTREEAWAFCKLRAKYRAEHRQEVFETMKDALFVASGFAWFFAIIALTGIM